MTAEDRDYLKLIEARNDPDADKRWLVARLEAEAAIIRTISQVICGKDEFPGNLARYVQNEVEGRRTAEAERDAMQAEMERLEEQVKERDRHIEEMARVHRDTLDAALAASAPPSEPQEMKS